MVVLCRECGSSDLHFEEVVEHYLDKFPVCVGYRVYCKECGDETSV